MWSGKKRYLRAIVLALVLALVVPMIPVSSNGAKVAEAAVKINATKKTVVKGKTYQLKITGTKKKVTWKSSKKSVAKVNSKGKVTAVKEGTATITAKVGNKTYKCKITVIPFSRVKENVDDVFDFYLPKAYKLKEEAVINDNNAMFYSKDDEADSGIAFIYSETGTEAVDVSTMGDFMVEFYKMLYVNMGVTVDSVTHSMTTSKNLGDVLKITIKAEGQTMDVYMISVDNYLIGIDAIKTDDEKLSPSINAAVKYLLKTIDFVD